MESNQIKIQLGETFYTKEQKNETYWKNVITKTKGTLDIETNEITQSFKISYMNGVDEWERSDSWYKTIDDFLISIEDELCTKEKFDWSIIK